MRKLSYILFILLFCSPAFASPPSRTYTYTTGTTISSTAVTANEDNIYNYLQGGVDSIKDGSITNADIVASAGIPVSKLDLSTIATDISFTGDNTFSGTNNFTGTLQQGGSSGLLMPSGAVFFMITGSCPTGSTDVSATYANKYVKINATAGTSQGVILTGTSDSTTLTSAQSGVPAHTHGIKNYTASGGPSKVQGTSSSDGEATATSDANAAANASEGHTHTLSTATTLEPSSITMKACQVD